MTALRAAPWGKPFTEADRQRLAELEAVIERGIGGRTRRAGVRRTDIRPHVVYVFRDAAGAVLYIGVSLTALDRFGAHSNGSRWFERATQIDLEHLPDRASALARESALIASLAPLYNRAGVRA